MRQRTSELYHRPSGRRRRAIDPLSLIDGFVALHMVDSNPFG